MATPQSKHPNTISTSKASGRPRKTVDGERVRVSELNTEVPFSEQQTDNPGSSRLLRWWRNLNLVLAGMYTGLTCYGTPHSQRTRDANQDSASHNDKPDNRPI